MYIGLGIVAGIIIIILVYTMIIKPQQIKKEINAKIDMFIKDTDFKDIKQSKICDRIISNGSDKIYIKYVMVPSNSQITINCKEKWRLSWGGSSAKVGRAYPNNRFMKEVEEFANISLDGKKVFIIYYTTEHILKYINECELETIDITKKTYDYKLVCYDKFDQDFAYVVNN